MNANSAIQYLFVCSTCGRKHQSEHPTAPENWVLSRAPKPVGCYPEAHCRDCPPAYLPPASFAEVGADAISDRQQRALYTRDGRRVGNAIIFHVEDGERGSVYLIETDFGNRMRLSQSEILGLFWIGEPASYARWSLDRDTARRRAMKSAGQ